MSARRVSRPRILLVSCVGIRSRGMNRYHALVLALICALVVVVVRLEAQQARQGGSGVAVKADQIGGVVTSDKGPEAGVWVIAETTDTPTKFVKIVVTDDQGRYLLPQLPNGKFRVWVRGYGLVDSAPIVGTRGQ